MIYNDDFRLIIPFKQFLRSQGIFNSSFYSQFNNEKNRQNFKVFFIYFKKYTQIYFEDLQDLTKQIKELKIKNLLLLNN